MVEAKTVILMHGLTRHKEVFGTTVQYLTKQGYKVVYFDLPGHGQNKDKEVNYKVAVNQLLSLSQHVETPVYVVAESVGTSVAIEAIRRSPEAFKGAVLISTGKPRVFNLWAITQRFLSGIWRLNHPLDVTYFIKKYASDDPAIIEEMLSDPLNKNKLTGKELLKTLWFLSKTNGKDLTLPLLIISGDRDRIVRGAKRIYDESPSSDKSFVEINSGHVILQTHYPHYDALKVVSEWLNLR